ncbi:hypothetical protein BDV23DRAFT_54799 [Aspergillus alliaceus]|uniref:Uncharacterized protein n=1 Tax=Petromyces alliaceus TaxID=209559 RepID=A0A5N7CDZ4_PETAA|nr:hypothetical protein BDV23DRAFT_54799 [Aspergillus alliaceus]
MKSFWEMEGRVPSLARTFVLFVLMPQAIVFCSKDQRFATYGNCYWINYIIVLRAWVKSIYTVLLYWYTTSVTGI